MPVILTTLTTMAGFLSMLLIDNTAIRQMGTGAALGIVLAGIATWTILPVIIIHLKPLKFKQSASHEYTLKSLKKIQGLPTIIITIVIIAASIPGILNLSSDFSVLSVYKKRTEVRKSIEKTTEALGGAIPVMVMFDSKSPLDMTTANAILEFQKLTEEQKISAASGSIFSTAELLIKKQMGMNNLPTNRAFQNRIINMMKSVSPDIIDKFYNKEGKGRAYFFLPDLSKARLNDFSRLAEETGNKYGITIKPVGNAFAIKEMNEKIIIQQMESLLLAILLVVVMTTISQKSIKLGLISSIPIIITLTGLFGFMGYAGIELSIISGIMTGLTVGVGIDYAIHYVALFQYEKRNNHPKPALSALEYVATPVLANALGLAVGFTAMALSPFKIHVTLTLLTWVTMILSSFLSLSLLPTILGRSRKLKIIKKA